MIENGSTDPVEVGSFDPYAPSPEVDADHYLFHDHQFPIDQKRPTEHGTPPMRFPSLGTETFCTLILGKNNKQWLTWRIRNNNIKTSGGYPFPFKQIVKGRGHFVSGSGVRELRMTLPDAERLVHVLFQNDQLDHQEFLDAMNVITAMARTHGVAASTGKESG